jgi:hypothetical protein
VPPVARDGSRPEFSNRSDRYSEIGITAVVDDDEQMFGRLAGILWSTETPIL